MSKGVRAGGTIEGRRGLGWLPDYPDLRDYTSRSEAVAPLLEKTAVPKLAAERTPAKSHLASQLPAMLAGLAGDWWVLIENEWGDTGESRCEPER